MGTLLEDAETKTAALERVEEMEESLATVRRAEPKRTLAERGAQRLMMTNNCLHTQMTERLLEVENEAMLKIVELEKQLMQTNKELDHIRVRVSKSVIVLVSGSMI